MKRKTFFKSISIVIVLMLSATITHAQVRGSGDVVKQERSVGSFHGVSVSGGIDLKIQQGSKTALVVETDDNLQEYILSEVEDGVLRVYVKKNSKIQHRTSMKAHVTVVDIKKISASGGGDVASVSMINADELGISLSGGGDLAFELTANKAKYNLSGGGDAAVEGDVKEVGVSLSGGGDLVMDGQLGMVKLSLSGGGDAVIDGGNGGSLSANMSGGGDFVMDMACKEFKISSTGGGDVSVDLGSNAEMVDVSMDGGGDLVMEVVTSECKISVGGGGDAALEGSAQKFYGEMRSGGDLSATEFKVENAVLKLTGGSDAKVLVTNELKVDASGGSQIYVDGDPHIDANLSGGSKVHH